MRVVVNQPTYLPWMGYFAMMHIADVFVFYDDVQFSPQSWQQRNRIKTPQGVRWITVPVERNFGQKICDTQINTDQVWRRKHWKTIEQAYSKTPYYDMYGSYIEELYQTYFLKLSDLNIYFIKWLAELMDIKRPKFYLSSEMGLEGDRSGRLLSLLKKVGATEYISGLKAKDYLREDDFKKAGIKLTWFNYKHPEYPQIRRKLGFIPYLSVVDLLLNNGSRSIGFIEEGLNGL
jgi:hypothetical protein